MSTFEDRPYRLKSYAWPWGKPEDKPWRPSPVIDKRDMRDPEDVGRCKCSAFGLDTSLCALHSHRFTIVLDDDYDLESQPRGV